VKGKRVDTRVINFATIDAPLARSQTKAIMGLVQQHLTNHTCASVAVPFPYDSADTDNEVFVATSRDAVLSLVESVLQGHARLLALTAADMVTALPPELSIICIPQRAFPFDAFINRQGMIMDEMAAGAHIGVMSMRSRRQMANQWPQLVFEIRRGGVDKTMETHVRKAEIDGLVIPAAVTEHLGIQSIVAEIFAPEFVLPSPGQGIMVIIGRANDTEMRQLLADLHSPSTAAELTAEHAFRDNMISDQDLPVGTLARVCGDNICIVGATGSGIDRIEISGKIHEAAAVGAGLAQQILSSGQCFADLLEADFPDGFLDEPAAEQTDAQPDDFTGDDAPPAKSASELDEIERIRAFEDLAGIDENETRDTADDEDEDDPYD